MRFCMDRSAEPLGVEAEDDVNNVSDSEGEEEDERDDVDVEGALTACLTD